MEAMSNTATQEILDTVEMDANNGVQISMRVFYKMLSDAIVKEKQQILDAYNQGYRDGEVDAANPNSNDLDIASFSNAETYYNEKYNNDNTKGG